ncbi:hypothetical protein ABEB36_000744 [Hypothenemus hampei]|uniref:Uncharacterized protein n=1 Tax=Hypothenemus hampei TaxID=57062 RepID=A0ABD1FFJ7_HYPHA
MKILIILFSLWPFTLCEVPPPYFHQKFKPSPLLDFEQPPRSLNIKIPGKFTIEQLIRLTEQLQSSRQNQNLPLKQSTYLPPNQLRPPSPSQPPISYGAPPQNALPHVQYGPPARPDKIEWKPPTTSYGVPVETFEPQRQNILRQNLVEQALPYNKPPRQYLPPSTTPQPSTTPTNIFTSTEPPTVTVSDNLSTPAPSSGQEQDARDPNLAISNAFAGNTGVFYLQQPDGRFQRVILQRIQEPNSKPEEYVANYYFQNIQRAPEAVYAPLITLGSDYVQQ